MQKFRARYFRSQHPIACEAGFTVVEIIITMAIMTILSAVATSQIMAWLPDMRLKGAARELFSNMHFARTQAIRTNQDWAIVFDTVAGSYAVCSASGFDGVWSTLADNTVEKTVVLASYGSGVAYGHGNVTGNNSVPGDAFPGDDVSYNSNVAVFNPSGTGSAGYVYFDNLNNVTTYAVGSLSSGVIRLRKWLGLGGGWR